MFLCSVMQNLVVPRFKKIYLILSFYLYQGINSTFIVVLYFYMLKKIKEIELVKIKLGGQM